MVDAFGPTPESCGAVLLCSPIIMAGTLPPAAVLPVRGLDVSSTMLEAAGELLSWELSPRIAFAMEAALNAAVRVLNGGGLDVRRRHEDELSLVGWLEAWVTGGAGEGVRVLEKERRSCGEIWGAEDGVDDNWLEDGEDERNDSEFEECGSWLDGPGPDASPGFADSPSGNDVAASFFFSSASFRCCSSWSRSDSLMASMSMSWVRS